MSALGVMSFDLSCSIALIGTGNVATHLAKAFAKNIKWVVSRNPDHALSLASAIGATPLTDFSELSQLRPDIVLVSVADQAIEQVVGSVGHLAYGPLVIHTSGTVPKEVLGHISARTGIIYPLQTFSKDVPVDMAKVPFFNEACTESDLELIDALASETSEHIYHADAAHRRALHVAGVFTSNFTNVLLECVEQILSEADYTLDVVRPLLEATVSKAFEVGPHAAQTGPARRGDRAVMQKHIEMLDGDRREAYRVLSQMIMKNHNIPVIYEPN